MTPRRKRARKYISLREKLAAALSLLLPQEQRDDLRARKVPAKTVIALFQMDHGILHTFGGADSWHNITPLLKEVHREKSRRDTSIAAKVARIRGDTCAGPRKQIPARPNPWPPKGARKLQSRSAFDRRAP